MHEDKCIKKDIEKIRDKKADVIIKFKKLQDSKSLNLNNVKELMDQCNTIQEIIYYYLNLLEKLNDSEYIPEKIYYYKILSPELSKKHGITKIPEKERFFEIMDKFLEDPNFKKYAEDEILKCSPELISFYEIEKKKLKEPNLQQKIDDLNRQYSRWDNIYNSNISFKDIHNEEFLFYALSNSFLRDYLEGKFSLPKRKKAVIFFLDLFKFLEPNKNKYPEFFEFSCLGLLVGQMSDNKDDEFLNLVAKSIKDEINKKYFNKNQIENCLKTINADFIISGNNITINNNNFKYIINNYNNYNLNYNCIIGLFDEDNNTYLKYLKSKQKFNVFMNTENYFNGLLNKIILNYSKSRLAFTSIKKLFNINEYEYQQIFKEVTTDEIMKYVYYLPYNNKFDSARTLKIFAKIIIDPLKDLFNNSLSQIISSSKLLESLKKFVNLVQRKYKFQHEHQHLVTILLFFIYINSRRRINSLPKEIINNKIQILSEEEYKKKKKNPNTIKEAGSLFELFINGKIKYGFYLKELLFIANEKNDDLDCEEYKNQFENCRNKTIEEMINDFPDDQIMSNIVLEIKEGIEEEKKFTHDFNAENAFANSLVSRIEENIELFSIEKLENLKISQIDMAYNNYLPINKSYYDH